MVILFLEGRRFLKAFHIYWRLGAAEKALFACQFGHGDPLLNHRRCFLVNVAPKQKRAFGRIDQRKSKKTRLISESNG
jgi:hypothetical protein